MKWLDASEIVVGKVARGEIHPGAVDEGRLAPPMNDMLRALRKAGRADKAMLLVEKFGPDLAQSVLDAAASVSLKGDYVQMLYRSQSNFAAAQKMDDLSRRIKAGDDVDYNSLAEVGQLIGSPESEFQSGDKIKPSISHFQPTYLPRIDNYLPGMPRNGLWTIGGRPKEGKTTDAIEIALALAEHGEHSLIFSFEMMPDDFMARATEMYHPTKKQLAHWHLYTGRTALDADEVVARSVQLVSTLPKPPRLIVVDYADYMVKGVMDEPKMTHVYVTMARLGWELGCCVLLLAQFNDSGYRGIPLPTAIRYGRMAIAASTMLTCIHHPARAWQHGEEDNRLPIMYDADKQPYAYHIYWHSRFGFGTWPGGKVKGQPKDVGAIQTAWSGATGWGKATKWYPLSGFSLM